MVSIIEALIVRLVDIPSEVKGLTWIFKAKFGGFFGTSLFTSEGAGIEKSLHRFSKYKVKPMI